METLPSKYAQFPIASMHNFRVIANNESSNSKKKLADSPVNSPPSKRPLYDLAQTHAELELMQPTGTPDLKIIFQDSEIKAAMSCYMTTGQGNHHKPGILFCKEMILYYKIHNQILDCQKTNIKNHSKAS